MASGKLNLYSNSGKILSISAPDDLSNDKTIIPANINGNSTQVFKIADAINDDEAVSKRQLNTSINNNIAYAYMNHDKQTTAKDTYETLNIKADNYIADGINIYAGQSDGEDYIEIVSDGIYEILSKINSCYGNNNNNFMMYLEKNGSAIPGTYSQNATAYWISVVSSCITSCKAGDKLKIIINGQSDTYTWSSTKITKIRG